MIVAYEKNMSMTKVPMPEQEPDVRNKNFSEVALGYTEEMAKEEARRCLQCKNPLCMQGCPVNVPIPGFIERVAEGDFEGAYNIITSENALPAICGRVCPQENQCEGKCVRGIKGEPVSIGRLERFVADYHMAHASADAPEITKNGKKVAVVGCGPAGITCAGELAKKGYEVTVFEALHKAGGVLSYGIPEFRLPKDLVAREIATVEKLGVKIETNVIIGRSITIDELMEDGYQAVFVGSGAGLPRFLNIPGENLLGVYSANEFLTRVNLMKAYKFPETPTPVKVGKNVAVVGAGNVAMDAARTAKRLGAENVYIVYRRSEEELPARAEEVHHAKEEGIIFKLLNNPCAIHGEDGKVKSMEVIKQELGEPDASGRRSPKPVEGSNYDIEVDTVVIAIGQSPNPLIRQTTPGLDTQKWGGIIVDEDTMKTSKDGVYAGGDTVTGAATVILAMGAGKKAAKAIDEALSK
ncbi:MAG: NADPH-dependent glutamate synthase [Lachnospiraceae bacterium]|nr:NADPH-dependent glutamate synthase [Lachnospiraceae bacterium]